MGSVENVVEWTPKARTIVETASRLFYDHGITAVGVDRIAAEAGVTKKTLYDRFGSKERLVVEYLRTRDQRWQEFLAERLESVSPATPARRLAAVFDASAEWMADHGAKGCSMVNAHAEISDPAHPAYAVITGQKRRTFELFRDIATDAGCASPGTIGAEILLLHEGALVTHGLRAVADPFERAKELALRRLAECSG